VAASAPALLPHLAQLPLQRLDPAGEAGLWQISLPWPAAPVQQLSLGGQATAQLALGQWLGQPAGQPRRLLLTADGGSGPAPETLGLVPAAAPTGTLPTARLVKFAESAEPQYQFERHYLEVAWGGRQLGLALGLVHQGEVHWWEACGMMVEEETAGCRCIHVAGSIPRVLSDHQLLSSHPGYTHPLLHTHNWLSGHLYVRLHANGVCEVFARHINSKFFDDGLELTDVVPVLGLRAPAGAAWPTDEVWDGSLQRLALGNVALDLAETARLATPAQPGRRFKADDFLVLQPFQGAEMYGGVCAQARLNDDFIIHAADRRWPRGLARTLRFSFSLGDRSPRIVRYVAPYWWYAACEELYPAPYLPVSNALDSRLAENGEWVRRNILPAGFEAGSVPRYAPAQPEAGKRYEPGWEGDIPYAQLLWAYRSATGQDYYDALRCAYYVTDVVVDHAAKLFRMHGFPPHAFAQPMNRVIGTLGAWLETGDPYLLQTAEAVTETSWRMHLNSWPRLAIGRDACFLRGAVMLYRFTANPHFGQIAREGCHHVAHSQRANGSFGDQGGGAGIHQWGAYITKPWMGLLATAPLLDYLQLCPGDETVQGCLRRFGDWLLANRWQRDGIHGWSYQHDYNGRNQHFCFYQKKWQQLPDPAQWHRESLARLLGWLTLTTGNAAYLQAWAESYATSRCECNDHGTTDGFLYLPWLQAHQWRVRLTPTGLASDPLPAIPGLPATGRLLGPGGPQPLPPTEKD
jgi:hypothetical protein